MKNLTKNVFVMLTVFALAAFTMVGCAASQGGKKTNDGPGNKNTDDRPGKKDTVAMMQEVDMEYSNTKIIALA
jgi:hypothetical protein